VARAAGDRGAGGAQSVCGAGGLLTLMTRARAGDGLVLAWMWSLSRFFT
jgi:hypothetical protein